VPGAKEPMIVALNLDLLSSAVKVSQDVEIFLQFLFLSDVINAVASLLMIISLKTQKEWLISILEVVWLFFWLLQSIPMAFGIGAVL